MTENEFLLADRIAKIRSIQEQHDLKNNAYIAFSGGKDSTVLHYLIDEALPNNKIPRVFSNTGIEYVDIVRFVKHLAETDNRIKIISPHKNIKEMLEEKGYPFKSKEHSDRVSVFQHSGMTKYVQNYLGIDGKKKALRFQCPEKLRYQFSEDFKIKISKNCCTELKKKPMEKFAKQNNRPIAITGIKNSEGGQRANIHQCIIMDKNGVKKFHPLLVVSDSFIDWYIAKNKIDICRLYLPPFNFLRTGCKGCPYNPKLQEQIETMQFLLPAERKQCEMIWKPVYDEYRRIGYRLRNTDNQPSLFSEGI